jgi:cell division protein FtsI/penicillin-binding protein 2
VTVHSGTARAAFTDAGGKNALPGIRVAGKTGTLRPEASANTTSWFVGFAPSRDPEIALSVLLNNGQVWHNRAAEVARDVLRAYFHERHTPGVTAKVSAP